MERHLRKLDQEVAKFKMELEADNAGITEILERREDCSSLEYVLDGYELIMKILLCYLMDKNRLRNGYKSIN